MKKGVVLIVLILILPVIAYSLGISATDCYDGAQDPIPLCTCVDLNKIRDDVTANYELQNNIDCSGTESWDSGAGWTPTAGTYAGRFTGTLDGQGYDITGLYINRASNYQGLFGYTDASAKITNFNIIGARLTGASYMGGFVAYNYGNVSFISFQGNITGSTEMGGIVGVNNGPINDCYSKGNFTARTSGMIGGVMGDSISSSSKINNCYSEGIVSGVGQGVGGLAGRNYGTIQNSYSRANVTSSSTGIGGFLGTNYGTVTKCYSTGYVDGSNPYYSYGFGPGTGGTVSVCYWDKETSGITTTGDYGGGTPKTTAQMIDVATYTTSSAWDFLENPNNDVANEDHWGISDLLNHGYPALVNIGIGEGLVNPVVTMDSPADNYFMPGATSVEFGCSVSGGNELSNMSLYITDNSNSNFVLNVTTEMSGAINSTTWDLEIAGGNYTWNCLSYDITGKFDWGSNRTITFDGLGPTFTDFENQSLLEEVSLAYDIDATDSGSGLSCFTVNDTIDFKIDCSGNLENNTALSVGTYWLNISANDSVNNINSDIMFVNVTPRSSIGLSLITPTGDMNVKQNEFFQVQVNVSCTNANCEEINVSLDPAEAAEYFDDFESNFGHWATHTGINCPASEAWGKRGSSTSSSGTGPQSGGVGGAGTNFMYVETSSGSCYDSGDIALVYFNETIDYDASQNEKVEFYFHAYGSNIDDLYLEENSSGSWSKLWEMHNINVNVWNFTSVDLSSLSGSGTLRFNYTRTSIGYQSDISLDRINVTSSSSGKTGLISTAPGTISFYTNVTNPYNITLGEDQSEIITWWVNATGAVENSFEFFVYANKTSERSINDITQTWSVTIVSETISPLIDFILPTPPQGTKTTNTTLEVNVSIIEPNLEEVIYNWNGTSYTVYNDSLVLMMNFDNVSSLGENDTFVVDISENGFNGTATNDAKYSSSGKYNGGFVFDGSDDRFLITDPVSGSAELTGAFTIELWLKTSATNGALVSKLTDSPYDGWAFRFGSGNLQAYLKNWRVGSATINDNSWHHVAFTYHGDTTGQFYVDGQKDGGVQTGFTTPTATSQDIYIGEESWDVNEWDFAGSIDELRIWDKNLTSEEVYQHYISNLKKFNSTNWNFYINQSKNTTSVFDEGAYTYYTYAKDKSGNENTTETRTVTISSDITAPVVSLSTPWNNSGTIENATFVYSVNDTNEIWNCSFNFNQEINQTNLSSIFKGEDQNFTLNNLGIGNYNWSVNCTDNYENVGASEARTFSVIKDSDFSGGSTNFDIVNVSNITNLIIEESNTGKIEFLQDVDLSSGADINENVNISFNRIEINSTALSELNKSARLRLYNLTFTTPEILKGEDECPEVVCTQENYSSGTLTFNVTSFSVYSAREGATSESPTSSTTSGSSGGGNVFRECREDLDCEEGYSCYEKECVKLFDIEILKVEPLIDSLDFTLDYLIKGMADINGDVIIKFWLQKGDEKIMLGQDAIYLGSFEEKTKTTTLNLPLDISDNDYDLYVQVNFENYQVESFRKINLKIDEEQGKIEEIELVKEMEIVEEKIQLSDKARPLYKLWWVVLLIVVLVSALAYRNEIVRLIKRFRVNKEVIADIPIINKKGYITRGVNWLYDKKVYTDSGHYIGEVKGVILLHDKIHSLKIKLGKKYRIKGIIINYSNVKDIGKIVIIDSIILDKINSLEN